jgi:cell division protein FtsL
MDTQTPTPAAPKEKKSRTLILILLLIIVGLAGGLIFQLCNTRTIIEEKVIENLTLQSELDSLMNEHSIIKYEYGALTDSLVGKDSLIQANAQEIKKLIASQADYYRIRKKLDLLRGITQGYVNTIDSLYTENKKLQDENLVLTEKYEAQVSISRQLEQDKTELTDKVTRASALKAYNISAEGIRYKSWGEGEKVTYKARRVDAVKICFTLSENPVAEPGKRNIYVRLARPDNVIVTQGNDETYTFDYQGEKINFSMKQEVDYQNKAMDVCLDWEKVAEGPAMKGVYHIYIFVDGEEIGYSQFELE